MTAYATNEQLGNALGIIKDIPSWDIAGTPTNEEVGTGDGSALVFWLDQQNVVTDSYTLYYGATAATTDKFTETTHYALDKDKGKITLTTAGRTLLSTNKIYAEYKYFSIGMKNSYVTNVLTRAKQEVDKAVNSTFTDGTATNPAYPSETEIQSSEGLFMDRIITSKKPLIDVETTLDGDLAIDAATIPLATGDGSSFPLTGTIIIGSEAITYTGISTDSLTGCTRGALGSTAATHDDGDAVHSTVLFRSDTTEGTAASWTVQAWGTSMNATSEGLIYKFKNASPDPLTRRGVAERVKIIYRYGYDTIPDDIIRLNIIFAKRMLIQDNASKALVAGRNEFRPSMLEMDREEMDRIINSYIVLSMANT